MAPVSEEEDKAGEYVFEDSIPSRPRSAVIPTLELGVAAFGPQSDTEDEDLPAFGSSNGSGGLFGTISEGLTLKAYNETRRR